MPPHPPPLGPIPAVRSIRVPVDFGGEPLAGLSRSPRVVESPKRRFDSARLSLSWILPERPSCRPHAGCRQLCRHCMNGLSNGKVPRWSGLGAPGLLQLPDPAEFGKRWNSGRDRATSPGRTPPRKEVLLSLDSQLQNDNRESIKRMAANLEPA